MAFFPQSTVFSFCCRTNLVLVWATSFCGCIWTPKYFKIWCEMGTRTANLLDNVFYELSYSFTQLVKHCVEKLCRCLHVVVDVYDYLFCDIGKLIWGSDWYIGWYWLLRNISYWPVLQVFVTILYILCPKCSLLL